MADMTAPETTWQKLKGEAKLWRESQKKQKESFRSAEKEGWAALKEGKTKEGLFTIGGAYAPVLQSAFIGAATYALVTSEWFGKMEIFKTQWFLKGLLMVAGGYALYRRGHQGWGVAVISAGALILIKDWKERPKTKAGGTTEGVDEEAGYYDWNRDRGDWRGEREHEERRLSEGRWDRGAARLADNVFEHERRHG